MENPFEIEKNKILTVNNMKVRTDGYYLATYRGVGNDGNNHQFYFILIFSENNFVFRIEIEEGMINEEELKSEKFSKGIKDLILEFNSNKEIINSLEQTDCYFNNNGIISIKFFDPEDIFNEDNLKKPKIYTEWKGNVIKDGLVLSFGNSFLDYTTEKIDFLESRIQNLVFNFNKIYY